MIKKYRELVVSTAGLVVVLVSLATLLSGLTNDIQEWRIFFLIFMAFVVFAGGIIYFAYRGTDVDQKWRHISLGILYFLTILFCVWAGSWLKSAMAQSPNPCEEYGIEIVEPPDGYTLVNGEATIRGSLTKRPPDESIQLIGLSEGKYWPHDKVELTETSWRGKTYNSERGNYEALVVYVGENGRILFKYFQDAGEENSNYPGIDDLTADIIICDSVDIPIP